MSVGGWILLIISCGAITSVVLFCYWRILTAPPPEDGDVQAPPDLDTRDAESEPRGSGRRES